MFHQLQQKSDSRPPFTNCLLLILAVFTGTFFVYRDIGIRMIYGYSLLGLAFVIHVYHRLRRNEPLRQTPVTLSAFLLALVIALHFLRPAARRDMDTISYLISMAICMAYVIAAPCEARSARWAGMAMYVLAMAMTSFVLIFTFLPELFVNLVYPKLSIIAQNYYDFFFPLSYGVSLGTYSYTDYVIFLGMAVCCANLAVKPRTGKQIAVNCLSMFIMFIAMVVLGRRGELLGAAVAVMLLLLALCSRKKRRFILIVGTVLAAVAATLVLAFLPQLGKIPVLARYVTTIEMLLAGADITSGRSTLILGAWAAFLAKPLFGLGWGQYLQVSAQIGILDTEGNLLEDCHNIYLQFLCETGIFGTILLLIPIGYLFVTTCRMLRVAKQMEDKTPLQFTVISFMIQFYLLFLGLYDPSFQKIVFWCFYALALMFGNAALIYSGWRPTGPFSRLLKQLADRLAPVGNRIWNVIRIPRKEGNS